MLNKVTLIGNLGSDPEIRYLPDGHPVATISLATTMRWKDKQSGERKEETEWHRLTIFGNLADIASKYLTKGSKAYFDGRLKTSKWTKDGIDHYSTGIIVSEMKMLDSKPSETQGNTHTPQNQQYCQNDQGPGPSSPPPINEFDDDIPF